MKLNKITCFYPQKKGKIAPQQLVSPDVGNMPIASCGPVDIMWISDDIGLYPNS